MIPDSVRVDVLSRAADLRVLLPEWSALYERDPRATPYSDPNLLLPFHAMFVPHVRPRVIIARSADGALRGVLPLGVEGQRVGPILLRKLQSLISWHAVFPDAVIDPECAPVALPALSRTLASIGWDDCVLRRVRKDSWILDRDGGFLQAASELTSTSDDDAPWVPLARERELQQGEDRRQRKRLLRKLERTGEIMIGWEIHSAAQHAGAEFVDLHSRLKQHQGQTRTFSVGSAQSDFPVWLASAIRTDRAGLYTVRRNGVMIAGVVVLRRAGRAYAYRAARDPEAKESGLGILQVTAAMEACGALGDSMFELGPGTEPYKRTWLPNHEQLFVVTAHRSSARARLADLWLRARGHKPRPN